MVEEEKLCPKSCTVREARANPSEETSAANPCEETSANPSEETSANPSEETKAFCMTDISKRICVF